MWSSSPESSQFPHSLRSILVIAPTLAAFLAAMPARCEPLRIAARPAASSAAGQDWAWLSRWWTGIEGWAGVGVRGLLPPTSNLGPSAVSRAADAATAPNSDGGGRRKSDSGRDPNG